MIPFYRTNGHNFNFQSSLIEKQNAKYPCFSNDTFQNRLFEYPGDTKVKNDNLEETEKVISKAEEEIEKFERKFLWPLETSFDDSGCDLGSVIDDKDNYNLEPLTDRDIYQEEELPKDSETVENYNPEYPDTVITPPLGMFPVQHQRVLSPSVSIATSTDSDCDSGAFSRCSTPAVPSDKNCVKAPLQSPHLVLSVIKENTQPDSQGHTKRPIINPTLVLSCLSEAGKSSMFSSLENLSTLSPNTRMFKRNPKCLSRHPLSYQNRAVTVTVGLSTQLEVTDGVRGSLPDICGGETSDIEGVGWHRSMSDLNRRENRQMKGSFKNILDTRCFAKEDYTKSAFSIPMKISENCPKNCASLVTVNGQHICSIG